MIRNLGAKSRKMGNYFASALLGQPRTDVKRKNHPVNHTLVTITAIVLKLIMKMDFSANVQQDILASSVRLWFFILPQRLLKTIQLR